MIGESRAAGLRVSRQDEGVPTALPATLGRTAYRVVREALTNVRKHAADAETTVCLRYLPDGLEVLVRNGPSEGGSALPGAGQGLLGLRERVELLGGRLEASPRGRRLPGPGPDPAGGCGVIRVVVVDDEHAGSGRAAADPGGGGGHHGRR